jgi:hypothetical protein
LNGDEQGEERGTRTTEAECEAGERRVGGGGSKTASRVSARDGRARTASKSDFSIETEKLRKN